MTTNRSRETFCHTYLHNISMAATCGSQSGGALYKQYMKKKQYQSFFRSKRHPGERLGRALQGVLVSPRDIPWSQKVSPQD